MLTILSKPVELSGPPKSTDQRASSVYSQPGTNSLRIPRGHQRFGSVYSEVSPLTSPRNSAEFENSDSPDVSPIEPRPPRSPKFPSSDSKTRSHIPTLRKVTPSDDAKSKTMEHSAGPVTGDADDREERLAKVREKNRKLLSGFHEKGQESESPKPPRGDSLDQPVHRIPWKGASGRTTLVEPVKNVSRAKNEVGPIPKRKETPKQVDGLRNNPASSSNTASSSRTTEAPKHPEYSLSIQVVDDPIKPTVPLKIKSPVTAENLSGPFNPRYSDATVASYENGRSETGLTDDAVTTPAVNRHATNASVDTLDRLRPRTAEGDPGSRFSWTTYSTSAPPKTPEQESSSRFSWTTVATSVHDSPHHINPGDHNTPPVPPLPNMPNAMALRQRAHPSYSPDPYSNPRSRVARKPTPTELSSFRSPDPTSPTHAESKKSPTATEAPDRSKSLPQCPPELEAKDRIAALEARMDELNRRRRNINQILKELNNVVQPSNFASDLASREEVRRTKKSLDDELSDIRNEEYKIGMSLHRALKKRDQENIYGGPTGLWVKRVTS